MLDISRGSLVRLRPGGIGGGLRVLAVSADGEAVPSVAVCWRQDGILRRAVLPADILEPDRAMPALGEVATAHAGGHGDRDS